MKQHIFLLIIAFLLLGSMIGLDLYEDYKEEQEKQSKAPPTDDNRINRPSPANMGSEVVNKNIKERYNHRYYRRL